MKSKTKTFSKLAALVYKCGDGQIARLVTGMFTSTMQIKPEHNRGAVAQAVSELTAKAASLVSKRGKWLSHSLSVKGIREPVAVVRAKGTLDASQLTDAMRWWALARQIAYFSGRKGYRVVLK